MSDPQKEFLNEVRPLAERLIGFAMTTGKQYGITDAKIAVSETDKQDNAVEKGEVTSVVSGRTRKVSVTLYAGERVLSFTKNTLDEETLRDAMMKNMQVIHIVPEHKGNQLLEAAKVYHGPLVDLDVRDANPPEQKELLAYAREAEKAAMEVQGVKATRAVSVSKMSSHFFILATNGLDHHESATRYSASASAVAEDSSGMQIDGEYSVARHFSDMSKPQELGQQAGKNAVSKLGAVLPATGQMPIVLDHEAAEDFFSAVYSAIDGSAIHRGVSFFKDKIGKQVMSKGITLVDDPSIARGLASSNVDSAGLETKKVTFVEDGVLKCYNVSLLESRQLGIEPTGRENGATNSRILPGTLTPEELISDIKEGIYIKGFNGGAVSVSNGTHSRQAYGLLIKHGKVTDIAVDGFVVSGNLKEMFMNVAVANDTPELPNTKFSLAAPTTRINGIMIAGK